MGRDGKMFETICRLCLSSENSNNLVSLIENASANGLSVYGLSVKKFAEISIEKDDKLPKNMCRKCLYLLKCAIYFKLKCESSEKVLTKWTSNIVNKKRKQVNLIKKNNQYALTKKNLLNKKLIVTTKSTESPNFTAKCTEKMQNLNEIDEPIDCSVDDEIHESIMNLSEDDSSDILEIMENDTKTMRKSARKPKTNIIKKSNHSSVDDIFQSEIHDSNMNLSEDDSSDILDIMENDTKTIPKSARKPKININKESNDSTDNDIFQAEIHDSILNMSQDDSSDILDKMVNDSKVMPKNARRPKTNINKESNDSTDNDIFQAEIHDSILNMSQDDSSDILDIMENDSKVRPKSTRKPETNISKSFQKKCQLSVLKNDNFECKICKKVLANPITYEQHMQYHTGCKYICDQCGKGFPALSRLQVHQVTIHGTGPYLSCQYCSYKAPRKNYLIEHERLHTGERPYTCDKCGLTFRRRAIWKKHMIYHGNKNVQCTLCPRKFFTTAQMKAHSNNVHERLYMYMCHKCDATYAKTQTVRKHLVEKHGIPMKMQGKIIRINSGKHSNAVEP